jgi:hypothetical protein
MGKNWQLLDQPIHAHEHALTARLIPAEAFSFARFEVAVRSEVVFEQDFFAVSRRLTREGQRTILEFIGSPHFR